MSDRACSSRKDMTGRAQARSQKMTRPSNHPPPLPGDGYFLKRLNASSHEASARRIGWFAVRQSDEPGRVARLGVCRRGTSPPTSGRRGRLETPPQLGCASRTRALGRPWDLVGRARRYYQHGAVRLDRTPKASLSPGHGIPPHGPPALTRITYSAHWRGRGR